MSYVPELKTETNQTSRKIESAGRIRSQWSAQDRRFIRADGRNGSTDVTQLAGELIVDDVNWTKIRNACRKRLKHHFHWNDIEDAVQEAAAFCWRNIAERETPIGLAVFRACGRVRRGQRITWEPQGSKPRWELELNATRTYRAPLCDEDYAGRPGLICPGIPPGAT